MTWPRGKAHLPPVAATASSSGTSVPVSEPSAPAKFLYQKDIDGHWQLFSFEVGGAGERQLTHLPGDSVDSDGSRDGRHIVFEYDRPHGNGCAVRVMDADGSHMTNLSRGVDCDHNPSFAPNGRRIVLVRYDTRAGTRRRNLPLLTSEQSYPRRE